VSEIMLRAEQTLDLDAHASYVQMWLLTASVEAI
tara:strand:- start:211 stop:312 length:102 start_codon:yes stop_codon:yes gene_type:complete